MTNARASRQIFLAANRDEVEPALRLRHSGNLFILSAQVWDVLLRTGFQPASALVVVAAVAGIMFALHTIAVQQQPPHRWLLRTSIACGMAGLIIDVTTALLSTHGELGWLIGGSLTLACWSMALYAHT